jgi:hypothetical protein
VHLLRLAIVFLLVTLTRTAPVHAATTAILRPASPAPELNETLVRLQGELAAVGLSAEVMDRPSFSPATTDLLAALQQSATEREVDAIIDVIGDRTPVAVDIWVFKRTARGIETSHVRVEANPENAAKTLAIRAIEVLRSRLVELDLARRVKPRRAPTALPSVPSTPPATQSSVEHVGLAAGAALLSSLDGVGPAVMPMLRLDWAFHPSLAVQVSLAGLGSTAGVQGAAGRAGVRQNYSVLAICYCPRSEHALAPFVSIGAGALRTSLQGEAAAPAMGHDVEQWSFLLEGALGVRLHLPGPFYLSLSPQVHLAEPYVSIHFVDTTVASTGRPNLLFTATAGAWL